MYTNTIFQPHTHTCARLPRRKHELTATHLRAYRWRETEWKVIEGNTHLRWKDTCKPLLEIFPKQVRKGRQNKRRETETTCSKHKATLSKPTHISSKACLSLTHSLTHTHCLVIQSIPHTYSKHSWCSRSIHSPLPPLPGSCQLSGLATVIPLSFKYPWHKGGPYHPVFRGRGAQQHHYCLSDWVGYTVSLYTPLSFTSVTRPSDCSACENAGGCFEKGTERQRLPWKLK